MQHRKFTLASLLVIITLLLPLAAQAASFADPAFEALWQRTDALVQQGKVARTWLWGPAASASRTEPYRDSPQGQRLVQYFDKSRMEINNPQATPNEWFVSNGLIVQEMASGRIQTGDVLFEPHDRADIPVAGDQESSSNVPTYATMWQCDETIRGEVREPNLIGVVTGAVWDGNECNKPYKDLMIIDFIMI